MWLDGAEILKAAGDLCPYRPLQGLWLFLEEKWKAKGEFVAEKCLDLMCIL